MHAKTVLEQASLSSECYTARLAVIWCIACVVLLASITGSAL